MMTTVSLVRLCFGLAIIGWKYSFAEETPSFVVQCKAGDNVCHKRQGQSLSSALISGYPSINVEKLDPFIVHTLDLSTSGLELVCKNVTFTGFSNAIVNNFKIDLSAKTIILQGSIDEMDGTGTYTAGGRILVLPIEGEGKSDVAIKNMEIDMDYGFEIINKNGDEFIHINKVKYNYKIVGNVRFHFENLFNGNKALSEVTHRFLNEQWKDISDELAPPIMRILFKKLTGNMKKIFAAVPFDKFIQV